MPPLLLSRLLRKILQRTEASGMSKLQETNSSTKRRSVWIPPHFIINTLQETLDKAKEAMKDAMCGNCNLKKATSYCLDCKEFFCQTCHTAHDTLKTHKDHQVVSIEDVRSGKVMLPVTASEDLKCKDHDGETKKFYCETCGKPICRDCIMLSHLQHQYISLKQASAKQVAKLKDLSKASEDLKKECKDAIKKTEDVQKSLSAASKEVKKNMESIKNEYHKQVDVIFKTHEVDAMSVEVQNAKKLNVIRDNLQTILDKLERACDLATKVTQMGSHHDITSVFPTLSASLEELNETTKPMAAPESLGYVRFKAPDAFDIPNLFSVLSVKLEDKWIQSGHINNKSELNFPWGIAVNHDGDVIVNGYDKYCKLFSKDGKVKYTFQGPFGESLFRIAITADKRYIIPGKAEILFYDQKGNMLNKVSTYDMSNQPSNPKAVAVDLEGRILAGLEGKTISINYADGRLISKFATSDIPTDIAVTANGDIAALIGNNVQLMDYSGNNVRVVQPPQEVTECIQYTVGCSKQGEIFVVNRGNPTAIYRYTADGEQCLGCVIRGLDHPTGIAISKDGQQLFVAEYMQHVVKIFQRR
ncbi:E3 ubiquitin-protein ligase TRIM71-like [Amphiura filiformis]|uniref:E3 ubiquitin-protein ligase TRIM71-like n=1 Tax=Amphiura filiformis TaxID=82378 RepID=UPI003B20FBB8